jgi:8-oxo-dGTP diphosphatase
MSAANQFAVAQAVKPAVSRVVSTFLFPGSSGSSRGSDRSHDRKGVVRRKSATATGIAASGKADDRRYPKRPLIGVGALIFRRGRILMAQRGKEPLKGAWSLPGGALEIGESLDAAVRREVREETGLEVKPVEVFEIFERIMRDSRGAPEYHYVLIDYVCRVIGGDLRAGDDVCRVEWVRQRDLPKFQITEGTLAVIERAFQRVGAGHARPAGVFAFLPSQTWSPKGARK